MVDFSNSNGAVMIADGGTPRILTIKARADISGGYWVNGSSAANVVGSGADTYVASDIEGFPVSTVVGSNVIGLAVQTIPSGTYGPIAMRGIFLMPTASGTIIGSVYSGWKVAAGSAGTVVALCSGTVLGVSVMGGVGPAELSVGRALTTADNTGGFIAVSLNL